MLQDVLGKNAVGVPCHEWRISSDFNMCKHARTQLSVSTELAPLFKSLGTFPALRGKNQTFTKLFVRSIAYQPPPFALNEGP